MSRSGGHSAFSPLRFLLYAKDLSNAILRLRDETSERDQQIASGFVRNIERLGMGLKLQGLAAKIGKLQHDAEAEAEKLDARVEEVAAKLPDVFSGAHKSLDGLADQVSDVEKLLVEIKVVTNGGPTIKDEPPPPPPPRPAQPAPTPVAEAQPTSLPLVGPAVSYP